MYAIVIGASGETIYAIKKAQIKGLTVLAFDGNENAEGLKYADESFVVDIRNPQNIFDVIDEKKIHPNEMFVLPVPIGRYLISTGAFNEHYGLVGPKLHTTELCTDKWLFHQTMAEKGLRNIDCKLLAKGETFSFQANHPVIIKPRYGAGSREVLRLSCLQDWDKIKDKLPFNEDFIIEDAVAGCEYGIDGMVIGGKFRLILTRKKLLTLPPYRQCVGYISINKDDERNTILCNYMDQLILALDFRDGIIHADIIMNNDEPFVIEMSARPSGHRLHDLFTPMVTGVDMISDYIDYVQGIKIFDHTKTQERTYIIRYFDIEAEIKKLPEKEYLMDEYSLLGYECNLTVGERVTIKDGHSLMGRGFFIMSGSSEQEVVEKANKMLKEYL